MSHEARTPIAAAAVDAATELLGELYRRGEDMRAVAHHTELATQTVTEIAMGERHWLRRSTAERISRAIWLLPADERSSWWPRISALTIYSDGAGGETSADEPVPPTDPAETTSHRHPEGPPVR